MWSDFRRTDVLFDGGSEQAFLMLPKGPVTTEKSELVLGVCLSNTIF
jgi:hypothetical protein